MGRRAEQRRAHKRYLSLVPSNTPWWFEEAVLGVKTRTWYDADKNVWRWSNEYVRKSGDEWVGASMNDSCTVSGWAHAKIDMIKDCEESRMHMLAYIERKNTAIAYKKQTLEEMITTGQEKT